MKVMVKVCDVAVLPRGSQKNFWKIFCIQMSAGVALKMVLIHEIHWPFSLFPVCDYAAVAGIVVVLGADLSIGVPPYKLTRIFVDIYFRNICPVRVMCLYNPHYESAVSHVLDHFKSFPVIHIASTTAAGLCYKFVPAMWADGFAALFYVRQCDFMAAGGAYAGHLFFTLVIIEKVGGHNGFDPAFKPVRQGWYPFYTGYDGFFSGNLAFLPTAFQNSVLSGCERQEAVCICMEITLDTLPIQIGVKSTLAAEIIAATVQTVK